jgi:pimeloyl-ACP methyl ester carboxylesterase
VAAEELGGLVVDRFPGSLPQVVVAHGVLDRAATFRRLARALAPAAVVLYDRCGYARSRGCAARGLVDHVEHLRALIGTTPSMVVGHSLGGVLALALATNPPPGLLAVSVYEAPLPGHGWWGPWELTPADALRAQLDEEETGRLAEDFLRRAMGAAFSTLPPGFVADRRAEGRVFVRELAELALGLLPLDLARLAVRVQAGIGEFADQRHRASFATLLATPGVEGYCIPGAPHGVHLWRPGAWAQALRSFLERCSAASAAGQPRR